MEVAGTQAVGEPQSAVEETLSLKRKSDDVGWEYGYLCDPTNLNKTKCKLCQHVSIGGEGGSSEATHSRCWEFYG